MAAADAFPPTVFVAAAEPTTAAVADALLVPETVDAPEDPEMLAVTARLPPTVSVWLASPTGAAVTFVLP